MKRLAATLQKNHGEGVRNPRDVVSAEAQRRETLKAKYGAENVFSRESSLYEQVRAASDANRPVLRGEANPFAWPETQAKIKATNVERYGAENPQQSDEIRARTRETVLDKYGVEHVLSAPEVRGKIVATNVERYGGPTPANSPEVVEKARQTNLERWGVEWTGQSFVLREQQLATMVEHYGSHFLASEEGKARIREIMLREYGVPHPMMNREIAHRALVNAGGHRQPNLPERMLHALVPQLLYTGDGTFWRWLPLLKHHKNPDFILPGPDADNSKRGVTKVVELFGDFWHSRMFTGKANFDHEQELINAFAEIGIECLVVWESDVKKKREEVRSRVEEFLAGHGSSSKKTPDGA
jgi:hypothetical protein